MGSVNVSVTTGGIVSVQPRSVKKSNPFTCLGWVKDPVFDASNSLILMAISDLNDDVETSDEAIKFELIQESFDCRLRFSNSISKRVDLNLGIKLNDSFWHFIAYICVGDGSMVYYVDGQELAAEEGVGDDGVLNSIAWSRNVRLGGGYVWVPYLYNVGQSITIYNWRYASDLILHKAWINELMQEDQQRLFV